MDFIDPKLLSIEELLDQANHALCRRNPVSLFSLASDLCRRSTHSDILQKQTLYYTYFLGKEEFGQNHLGVFTLAQTLRDLSHGKYGPTAANWALKKHLDVGSRKFEKVLRDQNESMLFEMNDRYLEAERFVIKNNPFSKQPENSPLSLSFLTEPVVKTWNCFIDEVGKTLPSIANDLVYWTSLNAKGQRGSPLEILKPVRNIQKLFCSGALVQEARSRKRFQSPTAVFQEESLELSSLKESAGYRLG